MVVRTFNFWKMRVNKEDRVPVVISVMQMKERPRQQGQEHRKCAHRSGQPLHKVRFSCTVDRKSTIPVAIESGTRRTAERCKKFSRGLSERSERYPRSTQPRVPRNPQGCEDIRDSVSGGCALRA